MLEPAVVEEIDDESILLIRRRVEDLPETHGSDLSEGMRGQRRHRHAVQVPVSVTLDRVRVAGRKLDARFLRGEEEEEQ